MNRFGHSRLGSAQMILALCMASFSCSLNLPAHAQSNANLEKNSAAQKGAKNSSTSEPQKSEPQKSSDDAMQIAVFGGGCFWCIEAVFERVWGVHSVVSGYAGGSVPNPTYQQVSTGQTGHAEVCLIEFDPQVVSYEELLKIFFKSHDPTLLNAQGPDRGTQYRSVIYFANEEQRDAIAQTLEELRKKRTYRGKIVTEVSPPTKFFPAEEYHQDYFAKHPDEPYCAINIRPKIGKFEKGFKQNSKLQKIKESKQSSGSK